MKQIDLDNRWKGYDGKEWSRKMLEKWYVNTFKDGIVTRLKGLQLKKYEHKRIIKYLIDNIEIILLANPKELDKYRRLYRIHISNLDKSLLKIKKRKKHNKSGKKIIIKTLDELLFWAFGYEASRSGKLIELANILNVKTCPYCNLHYTLCIEDFDKDGVKKMMAKFEFDHFFDKASYPILSMSLYNLIPSCPTCNNGKRQKVLPLVFNPYYADIGSLYRFKLTQPYKLYQGNTKDEVEIEIEPTTKQNVNDFARSFNLVGLYQRHPDIAQEIFARAYQYYYYSDRSNFGFIGNADLRSRLEHGFYPEKTMINRQPMTKFKQDLWEQAKDIVKNWDFKLLSGV